MATEYKLSYTASEIDEKLGKIDTISDHEDRISALEQNGDLGLTDEQVADLEANTTARHTHENKELLDKFDGNNDGISYSSKPMRFKADGKVITGVDYTDDEIVINLDGGVEFDGVFYPTDPIVIPLGGGSGGVTITDDGNGNVTIG